MMFYWRNAFHLFSYEYHRLNAIRAHFLSAVLASLIFMLGQFFLFRYVYSYSRIIGGYDFSQMITYLMMTLFIRNVTSVPIDYQISYLARTGNIAQRLTKPMPLFVYSFSTVVGRSLQRTLFATLPVLAFFVLVLKAHLPLPSPTIGLLFFLTLAEAFIMNVLLSCLVSTIYLFRQMPSTGILDMKNLLLSFLAGGILPLSFFPSPLLKVVQVLPFRHLYAYPIEIYLGRLPPSDSWAVIATGLCWIVAFLLALLVLERRALCRLQILGG